MPRETVIRRGWVGQKDNGLFLLSVATLGMDVPPNDNANRINRICNLTLYFTKIVSIRLGSIFEFNRIVIDRLDSISSIKFDAN